MAATETQVPTMTLGVSEAAAEEIKKFMASEEGLPETSGLRVRVVPGGCSGFQYSLNIEEESRPNDNVIESNGVRMFVDMFSAQRSEEHTSELQSRSDLVCRLLLEKKKHTTVTTAADK